MFGYPVSYKYDCPRRTNINVPTKKIAGLSKGFSCLIDVISHLKSKAQAMSSQTYEQMPTKLLPSQNNFIHFLSNVK